MDKYYIKIGREYMQLESIKNLLEQTYWAKERSTEVIETSMQHSICYGAFLHDTDQQIGFARVITDYATTYYICDVIVDSNYRGIGIGKKLLETIHSNEAFATQRGILATQDAHELYRKYGFSEGGNVFMTKAKQI